MTISYQRPAARGDWGTVVLGQHAVSIRLAVVLAGVIVWLGFTLLATGVNGVTALWTNLFFLGTLLLLTVATQTVGLRWAAFFFLVGGFAMWLMHPLATVVNAIEPLRGRASTEIVFPILEEALKILPVAAALWLWQRSGRTWALSASDVLLMAGAVGAGFAIVEDAHLRAGWGDQLAWLPVTEIHGNRIVAGHAIWATVAGATLGLALLLRTRGRRLAYLVGASGFVVVTFDHIRHNFGNRATDPLAGLLDGLGANGWLVTYLVVVLVVAVIAADLWVIHRSQPRPPEHRSPPVGEGMTAWRFGWSLRLAHRALAVANFQLHRASATDLRQIGWVALRLELELRAVEGRQEQPPTPVTLSEGAHD